MPLAHGPDPRRRASVDALRRPRRRQRSVLQRRARRHHRADRPQRRRQDHRLQLHHRLLQADARAASPCARRPRRQERCATPSPRRGKRHARAAVGRHLSARAHARFRDRREGARRAHVPEHPPVLRHDGARKPARRAAQCADARLRLVDPRPARPARVCAAPRTRRSSSARHWLGAHRPRASAPTIPPATCPMATSAGSKSRAPCAPSPALLCLDEPAAGLNPRESARAQPICCGSSATSTTRRSC